ncbi:MAG: hypothetical protein U0V56_03735 [Actinomycetota bacterium]
MLIGLQLTAGFPERWVIDIGHWFESAENWILENDDTSWIFVNVLTPLKDGINALFDNLVLVLNRLTWFGFLTTAVAISGALAGWRGSSPRGGSRRWGSWVCGSRASRPSRWSWSRWPSRCSSGCRSGSGRGAMTRWSGSCARSWTGCRRSRPSRT